MSDTNPDDATQEQHAKTRRRETLIDNLIRAEFVELFREHARTRHDASQEPRNDRSDVEDQKPSPKESE
jgi:hypothetical protein